MHEGMKKSKSVFIKRAFAAARMASIAFIVWGASNIVYPAIRNKLKIVKPYVEENVNYHGLKPVASSYRLKES